MSEKLPNGWARSLTREIAEIRLGRQRSPQNRANKHARKYLRAANVTWSGLDLSDVNEMDFKPTEFENYRLRPGDILLSEASGSAKEVGKPALWRGEIAGCCFQNTLIRVRSRGPLPEFLRYRFLADALSGRFADSSKGVGIHHLGAERFGRLSIEIPPSAEQRRIVDELEKQLTRLDAAVAALTRVKAQLKRYRASVLKSACEGTLVPTEAELARRERRDFEPADKFLARIEEARGKPMSAPSSSGVPGGWARARVRDIAEIRLGRQRSPQNRAGEFARKYLRAANVTWHGLDLSDVNEMDFKPSEFDSYVLRGGDILLSEASGSAKEVGKPVLWRNEIPDCCFQNTLIRVRSSGPDPEFLRYRFLADALLGRFIAASKGVGIHHLGAERFGELTIELPPLAEQKRIVAEVDRLLSATAAAENLVDKNLRRAKSLRQAVLKAAFSGQLVPQDPSDEPASKLLERLRAEAAATPAPKARGRKKAAP